MQYLTLVISVVITVVNILSFSIVLSKSKIIIKNKILYVIFLGITYAAILLYLTSIYRLIASIVSIFIFNYFLIFNKNMNKSLYYSFLYEVFSFIGEIIESLFLTSIFNYSLESYNNSQLSLLIFSLINCLFITIIMLIPIFRNTLNKGEKLIFRSSNDIIYVVIIFITLILFDVNNKINLGNNIDFYLNIVISLFILVTVVFYLRDKVKKEQIENKYNQMMNFVSKYENIINEQGKKNHEFNNQLMVIKGYINNKEKLEEYLASIIEEHKGGKNYTIEQLSYLPDGGIKGLLYHKLGQIEESEMKIYLYIDKKSKEIFENSFDLKEYKDITKLLGIFLDNAIEEAKKTKKKELEFDIQIDENEIIIKIGNTYNSKDLTKIGNSGYTTKGKGHGFGLSIVKDIIDCNDNITNKREVSNDMFYQVINIKLKK